MGAAATSVDSPDRQWLYLLPDVVMGTGMTDATVEQAARNNALWCDAVCAAHGAPGDFLPTVWMNRHGTPRYYPDLVTLQDPVSDQHAAIADLDLRALEFAVLIEAEWIDLPASGAPEPEIRSTLTWHWAATAADVAAWEAAWSGGDGAPATFAGRLAPAGPDTGFLLGLDGGRAACGGVFHRGGGVVGLSNVFVRATDADAAWAGLAAAGRAAFPGLTLVGYEHGDALTHARRAGFRTLGPLRVWVRQ